jgi:hypothetical protein
MAATLVTQIGLPRSGMYRNILGALEIIGRKLGYGLDTAVSGASNLFFNAEQGVWYDPSDFSTLFQDSAGTTPVTAVEQPVGLILDKSGRGNHATQATAASRPVLSARTNLLTYSEQFDNAAWKKNRCTILENAVTAPDGTLTADKLVEDTTATNTHNAARSSISVASGGTLTFSCYIKSGERTKASLVVFNGDVYPIAYFDLAAGTYSNVSAGCSAAIVNVGAGWFCCSFTYVMSSGVTTNVYVQPVIVNGSQSYTGDGTSGIYIWGAQLEAGSTATRYQRIAAATDYDTVGFPHYLKFDGVDDSMATASTVDFTATDKMTVFAGVRKLSDATAYAMVAELSAISSSNNGAFGITAPGNSGNYGFSTRGTLSSDLFTTAGSYPAPVTSVMSARGAIATDTNKIRINGVEVKSGAADQGTGNYGNYPLYVGRRGGTTLPFNGHLYSLIIRGAASSDSQIASAESYVNSKTGAY